ncbi:FkbM family methyltransferase [Phenylobacterium sp.]|uniref:FkbM family methyltransferase n=1 Tax=Phenylobacterium sp. TaxID=1871053 RepID=UPI002737FB4E|nr:FkbM family methyltransferase [Phenylobacterium sp.]MDP3868358.1 FkbM family methyltransferase [Phenylobacterium sp.]
MRDFIRETVRAAFRGRSFRRALPASVGGAQLFVAPDSQLKYLKPGTAGFDRQLIDWAVEFVSPGQVVWDIGANVGVFTFSAAGCGAKVVAMEPDPFLSNLLLRAQGLTANSALSVSIVQAAASERRSLARLQIAAGGRAANSLAQFAGSRSTFVHSVGEVIVPTIMLDDLLEIQGPPQFIKIDVEGAEVQALTGAERVMAEYRPIIVVETGDDTRDAVTELLRRHNYAMHNIELAGRPLVDRATFNTLAVPQAT